MDKISWKLLTFGLSYQYFLMNDSYKKERVFEQIFLELTELRKKDLKDFTNEIEGKACSYSYRLI